MKKFLEQTNQNPMSANVLVPTTAVTGNVRMRVAMKWGGYPTPCETFGTGEVEDYTVVIQGGTDPCTTDAIPPVFQNCPSNIVLTTMTTTAISTWIPPTATDNCTPAPSVSSTHASGFAFPIGTTNVVYTASDAKNNTATCRFSVTVQTQSTGNADIALSIAATPSVYKPYTPLDFTISAKNNGSQVLQMLKLNLNFLKTPSMEAVRPPQ